MGRRFGRLEQLVQRKAIEKGAQKEKHFGRVNKFKFKFAGVIEASNRLRLRARKISFRTRTGTWRGGSSLVILF